MAAGRHAKWSRRSRRRNFADRLSLSASRNSRDRRRGVERKVHGLRGTNGGIRLDSARLNEDRRRAGTGTRTEAGPQSETNRREGGWAC